MFDLAGRNSPSSQYVVISPPTYTYTVPIFQSTRRCLYLAVLTRGAACQKADWKAHKGQCAGLKAGGTTTSGVVGYN